MARLYSEIVSEHKHSIFEGDCPNRNTEPTCSQKNSQKKQIFGLGFILQPNLLVFTTQPGCCVPDSSRKWNKI